MTDNDDATGGWSLPAAITASLHLPGNGDGAEVVEIGPDLAVLRLGGDRPVTVDVFARRPADARRTAEAATAWADLAEAQERGEHVTLWGSWLVPADTFGESR